MVAAATAMKTSIAAAERRLTNPPALSQAGRDRGPAACKRAEGGTARAESRRRIEGISFEGWTPPNVPARTRPLSDALRRSPSDPGFRRYIETRYRRYGGSAAWLLY